MTTMKENSGIVDTSEISRRERRKEARTAKNARKHQFWLQRQKEQASKKNIELLKSKNGEICENSHDKNIKVSQLIQEVQGVMEAPLHDDSRASKMVKSKKLSKRSVETNFEKFVKMDMQNGLMSAEEDSKLERKLAKKLKVKDGKLRGDDDDLNMLLEGVPSAFDLFVEGEEKSVEDAPVAKSNDSGFLNLKEMSITRSQTPKHSNMVKEVDAEFRTMEYIDSHTLKKEKGRKGWKRNLKTNFEKFLEMDMQNTTMSAQEDFELERKLAKKLKVKEGKLREDDDDLNSIFEGIPSALDSLVNDELTFAEELPVEDSEKRYSSKKREVEKSVEQVTEGEVACSLTMETSEPEEAKMMSEVFAEVKSQKKRKKSKSLDKGKEGDTIGEIVTDVPKPVESRAAEVASNEVPRKVPGKYVAPHLRCSLGNESEETTQIRRRVRGLLNRLSESNVESITGEISVIFRSIARSIASQIITEEVLASCCGGPRGNQQYAAVFAAFVAGMACSVGVDFSAKLMASLAKSFEDEYNKEDNLSLRNLTLLLSYLCVFGVCSSDLIYDFMIVLSKRLMEIDVSTILTVLECCGMKIRADDPLAMKDFILNVQNRVNELKASSAEGRSNINSKRMEFMLATIFDIKNNKKRPKEDPAHHTRIKKWLQKLGVQEILIRGLTWIKLLDPDKKGQWWLSGAGDMCSTKDNVEEVASSIDREFLEAQKMLQLAAAQRMNTDARKAIFCIIMSGEDYIDAFEKLLRLDLSGKQDREIIRVLVECCLQEKVFNKYYTVLASKFCEHDKNHKFTLQFCLWDHFKELESMQLNRSMNLAKFVAEMVATFTLSLAVLKVIDLNDISQITPKRIMHFRMLFEAIFEYPDKIIWNVFTRIAVTLELESLRHGIEFFINEYIVRTNKAASAKFKVAKKALSNVEGVLM